MPMTIIHPAAYLPDKCPGTDFEQDPEIKFKITVIKLNEYLIYLLMFLEKITYPSLIHIFDCDGRI